MQEPAASIGAKTCATCCPQKQYMPRVRLRSGTRFARRFLSDLEVRLPDLPAAEAGFSGAFRWPEAGVSTQSLCFAQANA